MKDYFQDEKAGGGESSGMPCERCIVCMATDGGTRYTNCWAKHYQCSLVLMKEASGAKGGPLGSQHMKGLTGGPLKGQTKMGVGVKRPLGTSCP